MPILMIFVFLEGVSEVREELSVAFATEMGPGGLNVMVKDGLENIKCNHFIKMIVFFIGF